jgi:hypothetical protein
LQNLEARLADLERQVADCRKSARWDRRITAGLLCTFVAGMGVAATCTVVDVIGKMQISGHKPRGDSKRAQRCNHEHRKVATTPAREGEGPDRVLDTFLVPRHVLEGPLDGLRHVDE